MLKIFSYSFIIILFFITTNNTKAQTELNSGEKIFQLAFVPQYLIYKGIRIDFEYKFKNSKRLLQISPELFYNKNDINYSNVPSNYYKDEYEELYGYGIGLHDKIEISNIKKGKWIFYFSYGGTYTHFILKNKRWEWINFSEDGLNYLKYELIDIKQNTDRFRFDINISLQYNYAENMFFDFYIGMGGVYSINNFNRDTAKPIFESKMYDYAFNGMYLPIGFRFGFRF